MKKFLAAMALIMIVYGVKCAETAPALDLKLDAPAVLTLNGSQVRIDGNFQKVTGGVTALAVGSDFGPVLPAAALFGESSTIAFSLMFQNPKPENALINRYILKLRPEGKPVICFYFLNNEQKLTFAFDRATIKSRQNLIPGKWYRVTCSWDGTAVKYYLDGELQGEQPQSYMPVIAPNASLALGPYSDSWNIAKPWDEDNCFLSNLKVWKKALSATEIAGDAGKRAEDIEKKYPAYLSVPMVSKAPSLNSKLDDPAWLQAASFVSLTDLNMPDESLTYTNNRPLFAHDGKNLYVAFQTIFPDGSKLIKGESRDPGQKDQEVWGTESFEFYVDIEGKLYRFAGNVAGGYCEGLNTSDVGWNGNWKYVSDLSFRIDNCWHWQGKIAIPFSTLGITDPVGKELKINFCRSWRCSERVGLTALATGKVDYSARENFVTLKISDSGNACLIRDINNPQFGTAEERVQFTAPRGGKINYYVGMLSSESPGMPFDLIRQTVDCNAGEGRQMIFNEKITNSICDRLLFKVTDEKGNLMLQQMVPFKLNSDYIEVVPVFGRARVLLKPRFAVLKSKFGSQAAQVEIIAPDGKKIYSSGITSESEMSAVFERRNPAGDYRVLVIAPDEKKTILTEKKFYYPGIGPWESLPDELTEVLPPFEPLKAITADNQLTVQMWGRTYEFKKSLLPTAITTRDQAVLSSPAELQVNGQPVIATSFKVGKITPARVDFTAAADNALCNMEQTSFLEYDGVLFNRISLTAKKDLAGVKLVLPLPESMAKFMHATLEGFGGGGRINAALDKEISIKFHPVVWVGEYEHGLSFFAESSAAWKTMPDKPIRVFSSGNRKFLEMTFATKVAAGEKLQLDFGLIATPVRPLPDNYPLNIFSDDYGTHLNQAPPKAPVTYACQAATDNNWYDCMSLNGRDPEIRKWLFAKYDYVHKNHGIFTPYSFPGFIPEEYPEVKANIREWELAPSRHLNYTKNNKSYFLYWVCPASDASKYFAWRLAEILKELPLKGIYFDYGACFKCNNHLHGCDERFPLLAKRDFYRRVAAAFVHAGVKDYVIVIHNSESVPVPAITHVTHFLNGEGLRQMSSTTFHDGKDILDTYTQLDFASEHSSLPWGVTSSIYLPTDPLLPQFGGGKDDAPYSAGSPQELYRFRMTKAGLAGALVHNTIPSPSRMHHGLYDKVVRIYDEFGVPKAEFLPYWRNGDRVKVSSGKDIYVSLYRSKDKPEILAVISHLSKEHLDQDVTIELNPEKLGFKKFDSAREMLAGEDPGYERLYTEKNRWRMPVKLGDFGVSDCRLENNTLKLKLKFHSVAIVKLMAEK